MIDIYFFKSNGIFNIRIISFKTKLYYKKIKKKRDDFIYLPVSYRFLITLKEECNFFFLMKIFKKHFSMKSLRSNEMFISISYRNRGKHSMFQKKQLLRKTSICSYLLLIAWIQQHKRLNKCFDLRILT